MPNRMLTRLFIFIAFGLFCTSVTRASEEAPEQAESAAPAEEITENEPAASVEEPESPAEGESVVVTIETSKGNIKLKLFQDKAPITVENFLKYADNSHYDGTIFHRVIGHFMIQGGGFTPDMEQKPTMAPIKNEAQNGLSNKRGTIAMARSMVVDSATSQFFINVVDNNALDFRSADQRGFGYCVFGEVIEGMDVVDAIRSVPTGRHGPHGDVPTEPVLINSVVRDTAD